MSADRPRSSGANTSSPSQSHSGRPKSSTKSPLSNSVSGAMRPISPHATSSMPLRKSLDDSRRIIWDEALEAQQSRAPSIPTNKRGTLPKQIPRPQIERFINQLGSNEDQDILSACCALDSCPLLDQDYRQIREFDGMRKMVDLLGNPKYGDRLASVLDLLSACVQIVDNQLVLKDLNGIHIVSKMLSSKSNRIIELAVNTLANCAETPSCCTEIISQKGLQKITQILASNKDSSVVAQSLRLISNIAADKESWAALHNLQIVKSIIPLLSYRGDEIQALACAALCECILCGDIRDAFCTSYGGLAPLLKLLNSTSSDVLTCCCTAIANCAVNVEVRDNMCTQGLIPQVSAILQREEKPVVVSALKALGNLALSDYGRKKVDTASALQKLVELMQSKDPEFEDLSLRILSRWSNDETVAAQLCPRPISTSILKILTTSEGDTTRLFALTTLTNCARINTDVVTFASMDANFLTAIVAIIGSPSKIYSEKGKEAFAIFFPEESKFVEKISDTGYEFLHKVVKVPCSESLKTAALDAIISACSDSEKERETILESGLLKDLSSILTGGRRGLVAQALGVFSECAMSDVICDKLRDFDVIRYAVQFLGSDDKNIRKAASILTANLSRNVQNRAVLLESDCIKLLSGILKKEKDLVLLVKSSPPGDMDVILLQTLLMTISIYANFAMDDSKDIIFDSELLEILAQVFSADNPLTEGVEGNLIQLLPRVSGLALAHATTSAKICETILQLRDGDFLTDLIDETANPDDEVKFHASRILHNLTLHESTVKSLQTSFVLERLMWGVYWLSDFDQRLEREIMTPCVLTAVTNALAQIDNVEVMGDISPYLDGLLCAIVSIQDFPVRIAAVEIVGRLARSDKYRTVFIDAKAVAVLAVALCPPNLELQEASGYAIAECCRDDLGRQQLLVSGGLSVLVEMVRGAPWVVKTSSLAALANASLSDDVCAELALLGVVPLLSELVQTDEQFPRVHHLSVMCLANLSDCERSRRVVIQFDIVHVLEWFLQQNIDAKTKEIAALALRNANK